MIPRICIIAGSDSSGGAGIQADVKTVTALGGYAMTAITALTAQNTLGVQEVLPVPEDFIAKQIACNLTDIGADAIKTGMLHSTGVIQMVIESLAPYPDIPLVLDPVMVAKGGAPLLEPDAVESLKKLMRRATLITPNIPEAELLSGQKIITITDMQDVARQLLALGPKAVLLKGGHMEGDILSDVLVTKEQEHIFTAPRIPTRHTHGTGCTLASAIACFLGAAMPLTEAVKKARSYVFAAIKHAPGFGKGHGPLYHGVYLEQTTC